MVLSMLQVTLDSVILHYFLLLLYVIEVKQ
jgi:hypothetical protein